MPATVVQDFRVTFDTLAEYQAGVPKVTEWRAYFNSITWSPPASVGALSFSQAQRRISFTLTTTNAQV